MFVVRSFSMTSPLKCVCLIFPRSIISGRSEESREEPSREEPPPCFDQERLSEGLPSLLRFVPSRDPAGFLIPHIERLNNTFKEMIDTLESPVSPS
jgi:hypothetical protein